MSTSMFSVVEYYYDDVPRKYSCGYCKKRNSYKRHGMWAHALIVQDYQTLIDRGWRRSGCYCYKPVNDETCCPMYTIRCEALNFAVSKSQRRIMRKMANYLKSGERGEEEGSKRRKKSHDRPPDDIDCGDFMEPTLAENAARAQKNIFEGEPMQLETNCDKTLAPRPESIARSKSTDEKDNTQALPVIEKNSPVVKLPTIPGTGPRKAKLIRIERARNRLLAKGKTLEEIEAYYRKKKRQNVSKSIEELLSAVEDGENKLELKLVRVSSEEFMETLDQSVALFKKYQMAVHDDKAEECDKKSFLRFLGKSPLQHWKPAHGLPSGYGSFHQQYWLNNKLIAVGVIDILPYCVSSVYLFYDPEYSFLSLGTFSSLIEVRLTRELNKAAPDLKYYYMGYYIHGIPKMRYKAKMRPSNLLCPETYVWFDIDKSIPKLQKMKYSRLNDDIDAIDEDGMISAEDLRQVRVYYRGQRLYGDMRNIQKMYDGVEDDATEVKEYAELVGKKCAHSMFLYRGC